MTNIVEDDERTVDTTNGVVADPGRHVIRRRYSGVAHGGRVSRPRGQLRIKIEYYRTGKDVTVVGEMLDATEENEVGG